MKSILFAVLLIFATFGFAAQVRFHNSLSESVNVHSDHVTVDSLGSTHTSTFAHVADDTMMHFEVYLASDHSTAALSSSLHVSAGWWTVVLYRDAASQEVQFSAHCHSNTPVNTHNSGDAIIGFINLTPNSNFYITQDTAATVIFNNVAYLGVTELYAFPITIVGFTINFNNSGESINVNGPFSPDSVYSLFVYPNGIFILVLDGSVDGTVSGVATGAQSTSMATGTQSTSMATGMGTGMATGNQGTSGIASGNQGTSGVIGTGNQATSGTVGSGNQATTGVVGVINPDVDDTTKISATLFGFALALMML